MMKITLLNFFITFRSSLEKALNDTINKQLLSSAINYVSWVCNKNSRNIETPAWKFSNNIKFKKCMDEPFSLFVYALLNSEIILAWYETSYTVYEELSGDISA